MDLVEAINDPDQNAVFRVTDPSTQKIVIVLSDGTHTQRQEYKLNGLTLDTEVVG